MCLFKFDNAAQVDLVYFMTTTRLFLNSNLDLFGKTCVHEITNRNRVKRSLKPESLARVPSTATVLAWNSSSVLFVAGEKINYESYRTVKNDSTLRPGLDITYYDL